MKRRVDSIGITQAKKVCPYIACPHNAMFQIFNTDKEPVVTSWIEENGACMLEITAEDEAEGVAGMRGAATLTEIAETYQVRLNSVQEAIAGALRHAKDIIDSGIDLEPGDLPN